MTRKLNATCGVQVFDCWFESGSMPYASRHYPFDQRERFEQTFPADFIAEGLDQTRGWFYTLTVLGTALFGKVRGRGGPGRVRRHSVLLPLLLVLR